MRTITIGSGFGTFRMRLFPGLVVLIIIEYLTAADCSMSHTFFYFNDVPRVFLFYQKPPIVGVQHFSIEIGIRPRLLCYVENLRSVSFRYANGCRTSIKSQATVL